MYLFFPNILKWLKTIHLRIFCKKRKGEAATLYLKNKKFF